MQRYTIVIKGNLNVSGIIESDSKDFVLAWLYQNDGDYEIYDSKAKKYYSIEEFAQEATQFVPKFYRMNPETEELLISGLELRNGMRVLIEDSRRRINVDNDLRDWEEDRALESNRWCTVGAIEIDVDDDRVRFVGVYDDGSKRLRIYDSNYAWIVKKDSIREIEDKEDKILELVSLAMMEVIHAMVANESADAKASRVEEKAAETARRIMGLF